MAEHEQKERRFRYQAIDAAGKVRRGVLKAPDETEAKLLLLSDNIFAKKFEEVDPETPITWKPRKKRPTVTQTEQEKPIRAIMSLPLTFGLENAPFHGTVGLSENGVFVFEAVGGIHEEIIPADVEVATIVGFPFRILRITRVDGTMLEFRLGLIIAPPAAKEIVTHLNRKG